MYKYGTKIRLSENHCINGMPNVSLELILFISYPPAKFQIYDAGLDKRNINMFNLPVYPGRRGEKRTVYFWLNIL
jgi:hypothetical protein